MALSERIPAYADWYFAYSTTYKILWVATKSATTHSFEARALPLADDVSLDVEKYLEEHYEEIILKPEISDPLFQENYRENLEYAHTEYLKVIANLNTDFQKYISQSTNHLDELSEKQINMEIDWSRQFNKVSMAGYEKGGIGAAVGAGLTVGGALTGKAVGGAMGKAFASKMLASSAGKTLIAKLSAPFASKAITVLGSAAAGGATGTAVGGPVGTVTGAGVGVLVYYAINEGIETINRDQFEEDTRQAIESFEKDHNKKESREIQRSVDVWFNDTINLLKTYKNKT